MATAAQITANQANAQNSTGPRSAEGKARSSQNAVSHGLTSRELVLREDELPEFESLRDNLIAQLQPAGEVETLTFHNLVHAAWTLRRCRRAEVQLAASGPDPLLDESAARAQDRIVRYAARAERSYYRALKELQNLQTDRALREQNGLQDLTLHPDTGTPNEDLPPVAKVSAVLKTGWRPPNPAADAYEQTIAEAERFTRALDRGMFNALNPATPLPPGLKY